MSLCNCFCPASALWSLMQQLHTSLLTYIHYIIIYFSLTQAMVHIYAITWYTPFISKFVTVCDIFMHIPTASATARALIYVWIQWLSNWIQMFTKTLQRNIFDVYDLVDFLLLSNGRKEVGGCVWHHRLYTCLCTCAGGSADHPHMLTQVVATVSHSFHNVYLTQPNSHE